MSGRLLAHIAAATALVEAGSQLDAETIGALDRLQAAARLRADPDLWHELAVRAAAAAAARAYLS